MFAPVPTNADSVTGDSELMQLEQEFLVDILLQLVFRKNSVLILVKKKLVRINF